VGIAKQLSQLRRVEDLREIWTHEAADFTPWLALPENLSLLSETLGLDLELVAQEQWVGPYRADLLCKDAATQTNVLVENQLEATNHSHLGQILTYAAGLNARTIIWIAKRSTDEHRAAVDWLNEITEEGFSFFLIEIELWSIAGVDLVAPKFNVVSKPNDWRRTVAETARNVELTDAQTFYLKYWTALREYILSSGGAVIPQKLLPQHWTNCALGRSGIYLAATCSRDKRRIGVEVVVDPLKGFAAKEAFRLLAAQRSDIERECGFEFEWQELPESKMSRIASYQYDVEVTNEENWNRQFAWIKNRLESMRATFGVRVKNLQATLRDV
jgi:hypothetical protein